jgi:uncharacterized membrane protein YfhO
MQKNSSQTVYKDYSYVNISIILLILLFSLVILMKYTFQGYPFMSAGWTSDLLRINLPVYMHFFDKISNGGGFWSWSMGIGTSILVYANTFFDPFTYIILIGGRDKIPIMMVWSLVAKIICEGLVFSYYLRCFKLNRFSIVFASILYAFCGYSLIMGANLSLGTIMVYFPMVLLAIEKRLRNGNNKLLIVSLFLVAIYSYYHYYITGLLAVGYLIARCLTGNKNVIREVINLAICGILVLLLSSFVVWPQIYLTYFSSRLSGGQDLTWSLKLLKPNLKSFITTIIRIFGLNLLGNGIDTKYYGYSYLAGQDYFENEWYVTSISALLFSQYLYLDKEHRKNIAYYFAILCGMVIFPIVSFSLNGFSTANSRWMFIVHTLICLMCAFAIDKIIEKKAIDIKILLLSQFAYENLLMISIYIVGCMGYHLGTLNTYKYILWPNRVYIVTIAVIYLLCDFLAIMYNKFGIKKSIKIFCCSFIIFLIFSETFVNYYKWYRSDKSVWHFPEGVTYGYDDRSMSVINKIKKYDNTNFYRIYKDFDSVYDDNKIPSNNDAMVQKYYGLKNYSSINNGNYVKFLQELGVFVACIPDIMSNRRDGIEPKDIVGPSLNYINGIDDKYLLLDYLGVKYYLHKIGSVDDIPEQMVYEHTDGDIAVYINPKAYPLAFVKNKYMNYEKFIKMSYDERINALSDYTIINNNQEVLSLNKAKQIFRNNNICKLDKFSDDYLVFYIDAPNEWQYISFSIPYDSGWKAYLDGKDVASSKINISLLGIKVPRGSHKLELHYVPNGLKEGIVVSILGLAIVAFWLRKNKQQV